MFQRRTTGRICFGGATLLLGLAIWSGGFAGARAEAKSAPMVGFADPVFKAEDPATRGRWLDEAAVRPGRIARIDVVWSRIAPTAPADATNPDDPAYRFGEVDRAVRDAAARGLEVLFVPWSSPLYAADPSAPEGPGRRADPGAYGDFIEALARRYSGAHATAEGVLPRVSHLEVWNEPNLSQFLGPQWQGRKLIAAEHYRRMVNAADNALDRVGSKAKLIAGSTAPFGEDPPDAERSRPMRFLREFLCLNGREKKRSGCDGGKPRFDAYSHHPINLYGGPRRKGLSKDDAPDVTAFRRIRGTLEAAEKQNVIKRVPPLWATEVWWETQPPDSTYGMAMGQVERYVAESAYLAWKLRVRALIWYQIVDGATGPEGFEGLQSGFFFADGSPKPTLNALRFPLMVEQRKRGKARLWMIPPQSGEVVIERQNGDDWRRVKSVEGVAGRVLRTKVESGRKSAHRAVVGTQFSSAAARSNGKASARGSSVGARRAQPPAAPPSLEPYLEAP